MATLVVEDGQLTIVLSTWEKIGALIRSDVSVPFDSIVSAQRLDDARDGIRGLRAPGTGVPGRLALGTWRTAKTTDFVAVSRSDAGYLIELSGQRFDRLVVSSPPIPELDALG